MAGGTVRARHGKTQRYVHVRVSTSNNLMICCELYMTITNDNTHMCKFKALNIK